MAVPRRQESEGRTAKPDRHPKTLGLAADDVSPVVTGGAQERQRQGFAHRRNREGTDAVRRLRDGRDGLHATEKVGVLHHRAGGGIVDLRRYLAAAVGIGRNDHQIGADSGQVGRHHLSPMRMDPAAEDHPRAPGDSDRHQDGLGRCGGSVVERRVRHLEAGERGDHRLPLEDGLQRALADLRLVGRVRRRELGPRHDRVHR